MKSSNLESSKTSFAKLAVLLLSLLISDAKSAVSFNNRVAERSVEKQLKEKIGIKDSGLRKRKVHYNLEIGVINSFERVKITFNKDLKQQILKAADGTKILDETDRKLQDLIAGMVEENKDWADKVNGENKNLLKKNLSDFVKTTQNIVLGLENQDNVKQHLVKLINILGINEDSTPNTYNLLNYGDEKGTGFGILLTLIKKPEIVKTGLSIEEINSARKEYMYDVLQKDIDSWKKDGKWIVKGEERSDDEYFPTGSINLSFGFSIDFDISKSMYLIAGVGGSVDLDSRDRKISAVEELSKYVKTKEAAITWSINHTITPKIGIGYRIKQNVSLELAVYDRITKVTCDCSSLYDMPQFKFLEKAIPNVTNGLSNVLPREQQTKWVHRFGIEMCVKAFLKNNFFSRVGAFVTFPTQLFKGFRPLDLKMYSYGIYASFGYQF